MELKCWYWQKVNWNGNWEHFLSRLYWGNWENGSYFKNKILNPTKKTVAGCWNWKAYSVKIECDSITDILFQMINIFIILSWLWNLYLAMPATPIFNGSCHPSCCSWFVTSVRKLTHENGPTLHCLFFPVRFLVFTQFMFIWFQFLHFLH